MSVGNRAEAFHEITVGQDDQTKIVNSMERLTLADQVQCMGNQAVTQGLTELAEVRNDYQANKMFSSADDVHQLSSFGKDMNLMRSSWDINQTQDENIRSQRTIKYTEKGLSYKMSLLNERRKRLTKRILTQSSEINEMLNSYKNYVTVKEKIMQFVDKFEMLVEVHEEMLELQGGSNEAAWFGDIDEKVFAFRHKVNNWLKEAVEVRSKKSSVSSSSSKHSSTSSKSRSSTKDKAIQGKMRIAELLAEATFLEKKKTAQHQADELRVQEELAKAKARMKIFDAEEASKHIETPRRMLNFGNDKSAIKPEINTFDQDVLKHHQYFQIPVDKKNTIDCMNQDNFNKKGGSGWRKEVHGTTNMRLILMR